VFAFFFKKKKNQEDAAKKIAVQAKLKLINMLRKKMEKRETEEIAPAVVEEVKNIDLKKEEMRSVEVKKPSEEVHRASEDELQKANNRNNRNKKKRKKNNSFKKWESAETTTTTVEEGMTNNLSARRKRWKRDPVTDDAKEQVWLFSFFCLLFKCSLTLVQKPMEEGDARAYVAEWSVAPRDLSGASSSSSSFSSSLEELWTMLRDVLPDANQPSDFSVLFHESGKGLFGRV
jgi:hypothetical protein